MKPLRHLGPDLVALRGDAPARMLDTFASVGSETSAVFDETVSCQLVRRTEIAAAGAPWLILLHDDGGDAGSLVAFGRLVAQVASRCCVQGPFSRNAFLSSGHASAATGDAVDRWGTYRGYSWFRHDLDGGIEPVSLRDSIAQVGALVRELDAMRVGARGVYLLGVGDGATLARVVRRVAATRIEGVIALGGDDPPQTVHAATGHEVPLLWLDGTIDLTDAAVAERHAATIRAWLYGRTTNREVSHGNA